VTADLPRLPEPSLLADLSRETAAREKVQPELIEKDLYLTRLLWMLGQWFGPRLLLKGGTLLSKVDLGFFRLSEDADLVMPVAASRNRGRNVRQLQEVRDALKQLGQKVGVAPRFPSGELFEKGAHVVWDLSYRSEFGAQAIRLEVSLRAALRPGRRVVLRQLLSDPLVGNYSEAFCWGLDAEEARAEKVRAAFTREAIRDFYDLDRLVDAGTDFTSKRFVALVDAKLAELKEAPLYEQPTSFRLTRAKVRSLEAAANSELAAVLRADAPAFDLAAMVRRFDRLWGKQSIPQRDS